MVRNTQTQLRAPSNCNGTDSICRGKESTVLTLREKDAGRNDQVSKFENLPQPSQIILDPKNRRGSAKLFRSDPESGRGHFKIGDATTPPAPEIENSFEDAFAAFDAICQKRMEKAAAGAVATVNLTALRRNYRKAISLLGSEVTPAAVLKADGYGLGASKLAEILIEEGCRDFFCSRISEGVSLRMALRVQNHDMADKVAIYTLDGNLAGAYPEMLIEYKITPVLNSVSQVREWGQAGRKRGLKLPAILQFDSGMHRSGIPANEVDALLANRRLLLKNINIAYVITHLAMAGDVTYSLCGNVEPCEETKQQLTRFNQICKKFPGVRASIGASSAVFLGKAYQKDMVRMGGALHGCAPLCVGSHPLEQVLTLRTKIAQVSELDAMDTVGYGLKFAATKKMKVATIPFGFADGAPRVENGRSFSQSEQRPYALVARQYKAHLVDTMSMDLSSIDLSGVPEELQTTGTEVTLIGDGITPDDFGRMYDTNASETQTKLAGRIHREFIEEQGTQKPALTSNASPNAWNASVLSIPIRLRRQVSI